MFNKVTLVISHIVIILLTTQVTRLTGQGQQSPCPDIFQYRYDGNEWSGYMEIQGPQIGQSIHLVLYLSLKARLSTVSIHSSSLSLFIYLPPCQNSEKFGVFRKKILNI